MDQVKGNSLGTKIKPLFLKPIYYALIYLPVFSERYGGTRGICIFG